MQNTHRTLFGVVVGVAATDIWLIRAGHPPLSTAIRSSLIGRILTAGLAAHLMYGFKYDPLTLIGKRIGPK